MTSKALIKKMIQESVDMLFTNAKAIPVDKRDWSPSEGVRSVLALCRECAQSPQITMHILTARSMPENIDWEAMEQEAAAWHTIEDCEAVCRAGTDELLNQIDAFPEGEMEDTVFLPFTNEHHPFWDIMLYPNWNNTWHTGQIAYVQTMLGDREMHF